MSRLRTPAPLALALAAALALSLVPAQADADLQPVPVSVQPTPILNPALTGQWAAGYGDLGIPWLDASGRLLFAFGDTFQFIANCQSPNQSSRWRRGTLGIVSNPLAQDLVIDGMLLDGSGLVETLTPAPSPIPTGGATIAGYDFVHGQIIDAWCNTVDRTTSSSSLYFRPSGSTGQFFPAFHTWDRWSSFGAAALMARGDYLYLFGTLSGRQGDVKLARALGAVGAIDGAFEYWDGSTWQTNEALAASIAPGPVGEFGVQFNPTFGRFVMVTGDVNRQATVLRDAPSIEGPYTEEKVLSGAMGYAPFPLPFAVRGDASLLFTQSDWCSQQVTVDDVGLQWRSASDNLVTDGAFDQPPPGTFPVPPWQPPWQLSAPTIGFISDGPTGLEAYLVAQDYVWHDIHQTVAVKPNADYMLTMTVRGPGVSSGAMGARARIVPPPPAGTTPCDGLPVAQPGATIAQLPFSNVGGYTILSVPFNAGAQSLVDVFAGFTSAGSSATLEVDNVSVTPLQAVADASFEMQPTGAIGWPYASEGPGLTGVDREIAGFPHTGVNNAWINTAGRPANEWDAITQVVSVQPGTSYLLSGWVQTSSSFGTGHLGMRGPDNVGVAEATFGTTGPYTHVELVFSSGSSSQMKIYAGYWTPGFDTWMRLDDLSVEPLPQCNAVTSCGPGWNDTPPEITVTCPSYSDFYIQDSLGEKTYVSSGTRYVGEMSDYVGFVLACPPGRASACPQFSTYADVSSWCYTPGSGSSSSGGGRGKGGCSTTCQ